MTLEQAEGLELLLWGMAFVLVAANFGLAIWRARLRRTTGVARYSQRPGRRKRLLFLLGVVLVAAIVLVSVESGTPIALRPALVTLAAAAWLLMAMPGARDSVVGQVGVQYGWHARALSDLEEWRLTGDHLRWRFLGEWVASDAPAELHAELREQLGSANPDRESQFSR